MDILSMKINQDHVIRKLKFKLKLRQKFWIINLRAAELSGG